MPLRAAGMIQMWYLVKTHRCQHNCFWCKFAGDCLKQGMQSDDIRCLSFGCEDASNPKLVTVVIEITTRSGDAHFQRLLLARIYHPAEIMGRTALVPWAT
eukprot:5451034-Amphidinium_carterae.1